MALLATLFGWLCRRFYRGCPAETETMFPGASKASLVLYELRLYPSFTLPSGALADIARRVGVSRAYVSQTAKKHGYVVGRGRPRDAT